MVLSPQAAFLDRHRHLPEVEQSWSNRVTTSRPLAPPQPLSEGLHLGDIYALILQYLHESSSVYPHAVISASPQVLWRETQRDVGHVMIGGARRTGEAGPVPEATAAPEATVNRCTPLRS